MLTVIRVEHNNIFSRSVTFMANDSEEVLIGTATGDYSFKVEKNQTVTLTQPPIWKVGDQTRLYAIVPLKDTSLHSLELC